MRKSLQKSGILNMWKQEALTDEFLYNLSAALPLAFIF